MSEQYFKTDQIVLDQVDDQKITAKYSEGYVLTRLSKGEMIQTRSLRIDLDKFETDSENRRVLKKTFGLNFEFSNLPLKNYNWEIHKLGKEFYSKKFGDGTMSAAKIKEMFVDISKSNMNSVFTYKLDQSTIGYCLCYSNKDMLHYAYPFYDLELNLPNIGMSMMINAVQFAKDSDRKYIYLGSVTNEQSLYKLQFSGCEWWDNEKGEWNTDLDELKRIVVGG
jgi:arginyl-tRNA--protein-N-Asp/Glu arginylyltransferase